ncbi:MAG: mycofactocin system FadH/OYE family oxidoreductase 1 [Streptosporangiaceae bacterium]|nr:mycofactocin system FadH/OYE family oxidoreductase 1 [Streptosporangiaceae bacterium]
MLGPLPLGTAGEARAPSRVMFGPHETNLGRRRAFSDRHVAYYARRAAGGAGIVVTETASVHPSDWPYERAPLAAASAAGWASIAQACHAEGTLALASIGHAGGQGSSAYSQQPLLAPSRVPDVTTREAPKAMEADDIDAAVAGFGDAARLAVSAGLDGVEVNAGQHSLVRQFLSGLTNQRQDGYGTDRLLFALEVMQTVRDAARGAVVGLRLCCDELAPWAGITPDAALEILTALHPYADYVVAVRGSIYSVSATRPDGHTPPGFNLDLSRRVRDALPGRVAVVAQGSIVEVDMAQRTLESGAADAVEMTRAQIADPDLVRKVRAGAPATVRPCVLCNQTCQVRDPRNPVVSCIGEPASGHETEDVPVSGTSPRPQRVLVVGGGPGGLEAARTAALRGHHVHVVDRAAQPGGAVRAAAAGAGRERLARIADWLASECSRLGVEFDLGRELGGKDIDAHDGAVIICTGSADGRRDYRVEPGADIRTARSVLEQATRPDGGLPDGPAVIWDPVGGPIGISVAELLAPGRQVALVTPDLIPGAQLARSGDLADASTRLQQAGVALHKRSRLVTVTPSAAVVEDVFTGEAADIGAAVVIDAGHRLPEDSLWRAHPALRRAGDAVAPRTMYEAVLEGRRAALALDGRAT